jgi:MoxR-like ATPase
MDLQAISNLRAAVLQQVNQLVVGQQEALDLMLTSLLSEGHVLLEGPPGTAKTLMVRAFAAALSLEFGRIQFTPDLMPGDVIGTNLFNFQTNQFTLTKGPIFTQLLLADEINRTPPKTQASLLQAMQERIVSIDGTDHRLGDGFMVIATQNPIEQEGTYPLPEAQLDRFLFKINIDYPRREEELQVVMRHGHRTAMPRIEDYGLRPVADLGFLMGVRQVVGQIRINEDIVAYIVDVVRATRESPSLQYGASPRAAAMLATAARAQAALSGRDFVLPDDVKSLAVAALGHRVLLAPAAELEGLTAQRVIEQILQQVAAPR